MEEKTKKTPVRVIASNKWVVERKANKEEACKISPASNQFIAVSLQIEGSQWLCIVALT